MTVDATPARDAYFKGSDTIKDARMVTSYNPRLVALSLLISIGCGARAGFRESES